MTDPRTMATLGYVCYIEVSMTEPVAPRDLRNHYGDVLRRVTAGEEVDIVRDGVPVATVVPPRTRRPTSLARLREVFADAEPIDQEQFFADLESVVDPGLDDAWSR